MTKNIVFTFSKTKMQISCAVTAQLISVFVFASWIEDSSSSLMRNFKLIVIFCDCTGWFVLSLVGNPEDRFSHAPADMSKVWKDPVCSLLKV